MRAATGLSPLQWASLPFLPLPVGLSTLCSSHPTRTPELPPVDLCISEGLQTHLAGNSRKIRHLPARQLEELAFCLARPSHLCQGCV